MFEVKRFGKVVGKILGNRDLSITKANAIEKFGKGIVLSRVI